MNITVTFRHVDSSNALKAHAEEKLAKLQKFLRQPMTARVTVSLEKLLHQVEARISSGGERYEAHEATEDMYASIDKVLDKLERQIRGNKGALQTKKRHGNSLRRQALQEGAVPKGANGAAKAGGKARQARTSRAR